jgi:hypothetical protein
MQTLINEMECCFELLFPSVKSLPPVETSTIVAEERFVASCYSSSKRRRVSHEVASSATLNDLHNSDSEDSEGVVDHVEGAVDCADHLGGHEISGERKPKIDAAEKRCANEANDISNEVTDTKIAKESNICVRHHSHRMATASDAHTGCSEVNGGIDDVDDVDWEDEVIVNAPTGKEKTLFDGFSINGGRDDDNDDDTNDNGGGNFENENLHGDSAVAPYDLVGTLARHCSWVLCCSNSIL